ncbi:MAG: GyrI-like domain-containing protein [Proteobacteria bacterium]|nr:GyrI-like domain-containing protein [Pseudomonadota bacterium]
MNLVELPSKLMVGMHCRVSLTDDTTVQLWQRFMLRRNEIQQRVDENLYSINCYDAVLEFDKFTPHTQWRKWAAVEVVSRDDVPQGMDILELTGGLYAVFIHKGPAATFPQTLKYILADWISASEYQLDHREHFEILQPGYRMDDPEAEEEVWIPIINSERET